RPRTSFERRAEFSALPGVDQSRRRDRARERGERFVELRSGSLLLRNGDRFRRQSFLAKLGEHPAQVRHQAAVTPAIEEIQLSAEIDGSGISFVEKLEHGSLRAVADEGLPITLVEQVEARIRSTARRRAPKQRGAEGMECSNGGLPQFVSYPPPEGL